MSQLPNLLSVLRLLAAPVIAWFILIHRFDIALSLAIPAGLSDWLDGYLARLLKVHSRIGPYLDPMADKILLVVVFVCLGYVRAIPLWLVALVLGRDLVIVVGVTLLWTLRGRTEFRPFMSGKVSTFLQISLVLLVLIEGTRPRAATRFLRDANVIAAAVFTSISGVNYVRRGIEMSSRTYGSRPLV